MPEAQTITEGEDSDTTEVTSEVSSNVPDSGRITQPPPVQVEVAKPTKMMPSLLILFAGPSSNEGNLAFHFQLLGYTVVTYDVLDGPQNDLLDDAVWDPIYSRIQGGEFKALIASPPCGTFSRLRGLPNGPPKLRGLAGGERYGLPNLTPQQKDHVRKHTLLAVRALQACEAMAKLG